MPKYYRAPQSANARNQRKRYLVATLVTCVAAAMVGGALHVVKLGANRMAEMKSKAGYDVEEMPTRIRAAGEELQRQDLHEFAPQTVVGYSIDEVDTLLPADAWAELDSLIDVPAGEFVMGTDLERANDESKPQHPASTEAYRIDKYPVTNAQYARFVVRAGHRPPLNWENGKIPPGEERRPVTMVSWYDAARYCDFMGKRLPTEREWEKAARGVDGRRWPWGDSMDVQRLNTYYNIGYATDVDKYPQGASPFGVMDMAGNVNEWIADDFLPYDGTAAPASLFQGKVAVAATPQDQAMKVIDMVPVDERYKVLRGGSWKSDPFSTATYHRNYSWPHYASDFFGFRCAGDAPKPAN